MAQKMWHKEPCCLRRLEAAENAAVICLYAKNKPWVADCADLSSLIDDDKVHLCYMLVMAWTSSRMKHPVQTEMAELAYKILAKTA